jgi:23S rRNA pseudouridine1911/1915/1917 synthase
MRISVTEEYIGERLDKVVALAHPEYSRASIEKLINLGHITVNGENKPTRYKLKNNDEVKIDFSYLERPTSKIQIPVIYEDDDVVVLNKPTGILTHSKGDFNKEGTVATWLKQYVGSVIPDSDRESSINVSAKADEKSNWIPDQAGDDKNGIFWQSNRAGIVHRLDRGTSGIIICAKNKETQDYLQGQFSKRNVKKTYIAVVTGELKEAEGLIDVPIERNPKKPATFRVGVNGKTAQTHFKVLGYNGSHSLVELKPITGRTHQLRVHLNYIGHPIVGDEFYGGEKAPRLMLHAQKLELTLPSRERMTFDAPLPNEFNNYK